LQRPEPRRGDAELPLERAREVALVAEARLDGEERERLVGDDHLPRGPLEPEPADVLAEGLAVARPEGAVEDLAETAMPTRPRPRVRPAGDPGVVVKGTQDVWVKLARGPRPQAA